MNPAALVRRSAGALFSAPMRLVPRRFRFRVMMLIARIITPFMRRAESRQPQETARIDRGEELAVHLVWHVLTKYGVPFDPVVEWEGFDDLLRAYGEGRGVVLASPHAALGLLSIRQNYDHGLRPITITSHPTRIPGTRIVHETIQPSATFFVTAKQRLKEGRLVGAMIDRAEHTGERTIEVETATGPLIVSPALLELAARCGARVVFVAARVDRGRVVGRFGVAAGQTPEELMREYAEFVRAHIDQVYG